MAASRHRRAQRTVRSAASRDHLALVGQPHDVVQHHRHVAAQSLLDGHGPLGRDGHQPAVDVRAEDGLLLGHFDAMGEAEQLEAAAVGQDRAVPAHEAVQPAQGGDDLFAGPQREMIGVAQDHLRPGGAELFDLQPLDAGLGADRHEGRHLHLAVRRREDRPPRRTMGVGVQQAEREWRGGHLRLDSEVIREGSHWFPLPRPTFGRCPEGEGEGELLAR